MCYVLPPKNFKKIKFSDVFSGQKMEYWPNMDQLRANVSKELCLKNVSEF